MRRSSSPRGKIDCRSRSSEASLFRQPTHPGRQRLIRPVYQAIRSICSHWDTSPLGKKTRRALPCLANQMTGIRFCSGSMRKIRGRGGVFCMALRHDLRATRILNILRPSGWLDGQKHLRLPLLTGGTILASRPACVATTAHHPKMASAAALAGALNRIAVSAKPTAKKTNVVAKKVRLRRATHHPIHSVQGYRVSSTADTSRRRHLRRMLSGLRCARLGRSRCARALSMRVTSMDRFSGRVAIARGDRNVVIARHPLSSRWWLVNARGFLRRADPNPYPPLPALTIQAFNARALRSGPRDLTVRLRFTARENPGGERVQATIPPPPGVPHLPLVL